MFKGGKKAGTGKLQSNALDLLILYCKIKIHFIKQKLIKFNFHRVVKKNGSENTTHWRTTNVSPKI